MYDLILSVTRGGAVESKLKALRTAQGFSFPFPYPPPLALKIAAQGLDVGRLTRLDVEVLTWTL